MISVFLAATGLGLSFEPPANPSDLPVRAQAASSDSRKDEIEKLRKGLAKLSQDLSKAIAEGNRKASENIHAAIEKTKQKLKKAMESDQKR